MATGELHGEGPPNESPSPLEAGDRLTRHEFHRRYCAMPQLKKAELIEGVVYLGPPVPIHGHAAPHAQMIGWLGRYQAYTPGVEGGDSPTVLLDMDNEPQPDALLRILPCFGGQSWDEDGYVAGAAELIAEIAASSASYDLHDKLNAYRRNGVQEYVVWRVRDRAIDWFLLEAGCFVAQSPDSEGLLKSKVFPGLWLDAEAMLRDDLPTVIRALDRGLATPEHAAFVERLQRPADSSP